MFCLWINRHGFWHPPMSAPLIHQDDVYNVLCRTLMQLRCWNWWRCCFRLLTKTDRNLSRCQLHHRHHRWHRPSSSTSSVHCSHACSPGVNSTLVRSRTMMSITSMMNLDSLSKQSLLNVCYYGMFWKKQHLVLQYISNILNWDSWNLSLFYSWTFFYIDDRIFCHPFSSCCLMYAAATASYI